MSPRCVICAVIAGADIRSVRMSPEVDFFERVIKLAREHDILVVHDLAYADIVYDDWKAPSIMQVPGARDVAVEFFTLSKSYNMAGWRIGFGEYGDGYVRMALIENEARIRQALRGIKAMLKGA